MILNRPWIPTAFLARAAWYQNFSEKILLVATQLGFTAAEIAFVATDNAVMQFIASASVNVDSVREALIQYKRVVTEGTVGAPTPDYPPDLVFGSPAPVPTGIYQRLDELVKRIRVSPAYTDEIGALLGILAPTPSRPAVDTMQPSIKALPMPGSVLHVRFTRGQTQGIVIETKLDNSESWATAGTFSISPAVVTVPENSDKLPRAVQLRARYVERDTPVGQYSDIVAVSTQPTA